ncbi:hypothetical protein Esti_002064 [Eimeria stiedai]
MAEAHATPRHSKNFPSLLLVSQACFLMSATHWLKRDLSFVKPWSVALRSAVVLDMLRIEGYLKGDDEQKLTTLSVFEGRYLFVYINCRTKAQVVNKRWRGVRMGGIPVQQEFGSAFIKIKIARRHQESRACNPPAAALRLLHRRTQESSVTCRSLRFEFTMEDVTITRQSASEQEEADDLPVESSDSSDHAAIEAFAADSSQAPAEVEGGKIVGPSLKRWPFWGVLATAASTLLFAMIMRTQLEDSEKPKLEPAGSPGVPEEALIEAPEKPRVKPLPPEFQEKIIKLAEWARQMPAPEGETLHLPELEEDKFEEVLLRDGVRYIIRAYFMKLTPAYDPDKTAAILSEGVTKLLDECKRDADDVRKHDVFRVPTAVLGDISSAQIYVLIACESAPTVVLVAALPEACSWKVWAVDALMVIRTRRGQQQREGEVDDIRRTHGYSEQLRPLGMKGLIAYGFQSTRVAIRRFLLWTGMNALVLLQPLAAGFLVVVI